MRPNQKRERRASPLSQRLHSQPQRPSAGTVGSQARSDKPTITVEPPMDPGENVRETITKDSSGSWRRTTPENNNAAEHPASISTIAANAFTMPWWGQVLVLAGLGYVAFQAINTPVEDE